VVHVEEDLTAIVDHHSVSVLFLFHDKRKKTKTSPHSMAGRNTADSGPVVIWIGRRNSDGQRETAILFSLLLGCSLVILIF
jgi:hypothetical protein